jgi:hypothetical protein
MELMNMPRGLLVRAIAIAAGIVPVAIFLHVMAPPPGVPGLVVILYAIVVGNYFGYYLTKHEDEIFTRSDRD